MKSRLTVFTLAVLLIFAGSVLASEKHGHKHKGSMKTEKEEMRKKFKASKGAVNVGNKICPVSGEVIADMGDGKGVQIEHEGKIYNLCCAMCAKDFKKNPNKFIHKVNQELKGQKHDDHGKHKGSHGHDHHDHE